MLFKEIITLLPKIVCYLIRSRRSRYQNLLHTKLYFCSPMNSFRDFQHCRSSEIRLTIGSYDGVHQGHHKSKKDQQLAEEQ